MEIMKRGMRATMIVLMIADIVIVSCGRQVHHKAVVTDVRHIDAEMHYAVNYPMLYLHNVVISKPVYKPEQWIAEVEYEYQGEIRRDKIERTAEIKVGDTIDYVKREIQ